MKRKGERKEEEEERKGKEENRKGKVKEIIRNRITWEEKKIKKQKEKIELLE